MRSTRKPHASGGDRRTGGARTRRIVLALSLATTTLGFVRLTSAAPPAVEEVAPKESAPGPGMPATAPEPSLLDDDTVRQVHAAGVSSSCEACHTEDAWLPARFAHERTGYALVGRHARAECASCHASGYARAPSTSCSACHADVHRQELGAQCQTCHGPESWASRFPVDAHRRTGFPLSGRHAFLPCEECHANKRDRQFARAAKDCVDCHARDAQRTAGALFDHGRNARLSQCQSCHDPWSFRPARLDEHERCFTLSRGPHARVSCSECHEPARPVVVRGTCRTETVRCASCHAHTCDQMDGVHGDVAGYRCASLACAQCHGGAQR